MRLGDYQEALASDRETYESFKEQFGEDYPRTLAAAHNLAISLRLVGDCFAARDLRPGDAGPPPGGRSATNHPYTLDSAANLAHDMREAGAFRDSVDLLRSTLDRYRAVLGDDMLETLRTATSLAVSLRKAGEQAEAMRPGPGHLRALPAAVRRQHARRAGLRAEPGLRLCGPR